MTAIYRPRKAEFLGENQNSSVGYLDHTHHTLTVVFFNTVSCDEPLLFAVKNHC